MMGPPWFRFLWRKRFALEVMWDLETDGCEFRMVEKLWMREDQNRRMELKSFDPKVENEC